MVISYQFLALVQNIEKFGSLGQSQILPYRFMGFKSRDGSGTSSITTIESDSGSFGFD